MLLPLLQNNLLEATNDVNVGAGTAALTLTTYQASIAYDVDITVNTASLTLTTNLATVSLDVGVAVNTVALTLATNAAVVTYDVNIEVSTASLTLATYAATVSATSALSASINLSALNEVEVAQGYKELYIKLVGATWDSGADFDSARQAIINGLDSAGTEIKGWDNQVRANIEKPAVTRLSDTVVKVVLPPSPAYDIAANETVTVTVPAAAQDSGQDITASPTIMVSAVALQGTAITNSNAGAGPSNYEECDRSGFRVLPGELQKDGYGQYVRPKSFEDRHPQDYLKSVPDTSRGSPSPEGDDNFLSDGDVVASDL